MARGRFQLYRELSKSGIVTLVLISVLGGYLIGHPFERPFDGWRLVLTLVGILLLASGSSALNQIQERALDATMPRTAKRPLPSGRMSLAEAWLFVAVGVAGGLAILHRLSTDLFVLGIVALVSYNGLYTFWWKRRWAFAAVPGAVPGALPILMGYAAASGKVFAPGGLYLFFVLFFWQMPHFWSLALRYKGDYAAGGIPTLPVAKGSGVTVTHIILWCLGYVALALVAPLFFHLKSVYLAFAIALSLKILWELRAFVREPESKRWLHFFLWVNFSLILFIAAIAAEMWSVYFISP